MSEKKAINTAQTSPLRLKPSTTSQIWLITKSNAALQNMIGVSCIGS